MAKVISKNKDAFFNFELTDRFQSGVELLGWEVKSIRAGRVNLKGAFCSFKDNELYVSNMHVAKYMNVAGDETRPRKLLLHAKELKRIRNFVQTKGHSIVPTTLLWSKKGLVKLDIACGRGKTMADKRHDIKKRDDKRLVAKELKYKGM